MDPSFFGLSGDPFAKPQHVDVSGDVGDHTGLTTELHAGLKAPHGITLLIGDTGAGKSAFIRGFLAQLPETYVTAYLPSAGPGLRHLLTETIEQLGGTVAQGAQEDALIDTLRGLAKARAEHDRSTLIVLDEAHDLPAKTIERLGKLFGTDPAEPSRLHLTLVGRAELLDRMNAANDRSILKHLVQVCRMDPMGPEDAFRYIADRVQKVGGIVDRLFTQDALKLVVQQANGSPARIDALCSAAMQRAARNGRAEIDADAVTGASRAADEDPTTDGETVTIENEPDTPTYFFHDEQGEDEKHAEVGGQGLAATAAKQASAPLKAVARSAETGATSRRRLLFWAAGAAAVLAAFAASMTDTSTPEIPIAGRKKADAVAKRGGSGEAGAPAGKKALKNKAANQAAAAEAGADSVPKLVAKRAAQAGAAAAGAAAGPKPGDPAGVVGADRPSFPAPEIPAAPAKAAEAAFPTSVPGPVTPGAVATPAAAAAVDAAKPAEAAPVPPSPKPPEAGAAAAAKSQAATPPAAVTTAKPAPAAPIAPTRPPAPSQPVAAPPTPKVVAPPAAVASAQRPAAAAGLFTVQIGAFSSRANAESVLAKARGTAKDGRIIASTAGGKPIFRVVTGSFSSPAEAAQHAATLRANGYSTFVRKLD